MSKRTHKRNSLEAPGSSTSYWRFVAYLFVVLTLVAGSLTAQKQEADPPTQMIPVPIEPGSAKDPNRPAVYKDSLVESAPAETAAQPLPRRLLETRMPAPETVEVQEGGSVVVSELVEASGWAPGDPIRSHVQGDQETPLEDAGGDLGELISTNPEDEQNPASADGSRGTYHLDFEGIDSSGWIPPDTVVAVGSQDILEATNSGFAVYSKFGREIRGYLPYTTFFSGLPSGQTIFDPRVAWNPARQKYVMLLVARNTVSQTSYVFFAVSQTTQADGAWWRWSVNVADASAWMDYATLGVDNFGIHFAGNMFFWAGGFSRVKAYTFGDSFYSGTSSSGFVWGGLQWANGAAAFGMQAALGHSVNSNDETYFVNTWSGFGSQVSLWTLDHTPATPTLTRTEISGLPTYYALGENVDQPGSATDIDGGDSRTMNAVYANRRVFFTLGSDALDDGTRGSWLTVKLNSDAGTLEWSDNLIGPAGNYYTYPAVTLQGTGVDNNLAVFGTYTSSSVPQFPSALMKIYDNQPNADTGTFEFYQSGVSSYVALDSNGRNRWGDYSGAAYDWSCQHAVGAAEWTDATNSWSTQIAMHTFDSEGTCPRIDITSPGDGATLVGGDSYTITWNKSAIPGGDRIYVGYSSNGGASYSQIADLPPTASSYTWTPNVFTTSTSQGKFFVGAWNGASYRTIDYSDGNFDVMGCSDDIYEPDDFCSAGSNIALNSTQGHQACDADWVRFTPTAGAEYVIETSNLQNGSDTYLELSRVCGPTVAFNDDGGVGLASRITYSTVDTDRIDVLIRQFNLDYDANESYDIDVTCTACCNGACFVFADGFESGNVSAWSASTP